MNSHVAFLLYPGAILLFTLFRIFNKKIEFKEFKKGRYKSLSILTSIVFYLVIFICIGQSRK